MHWQLPSPPSLPTTRCAMMTALVSSPVPLLYVFVPSTMMTADEQILTLNVDPDESVENLKALLEVETRVPLRQQQLHFNGKEMQNSEMLSVVGVHDGDLVMMVPSSDRASQDIIKVNPDGSAVNPQAFQQHIRGDSQLMAQLCQVTKYTYGGSSAYFINNQFDDMDVNLTLSGATHLVPAWSVSILPDCKIVAFNTAKIKTQTSVTVKKPNTEEKLPEGLKWAKPLGEWSVRLPTPVSGDSSRREKLHFSPERHRRPQGSELVKERSRLGTQC